MLLHVPVFTLSAYTQQDSPWHRLHPRARLLCALTLVVGTALTPNGAWGAWGIYAVALLVLVLVSRVPPLVLLRRLSLEVLFVSVLLLTILFAGRGTPLVTLGPLVITEQALVAFGSVLTKATLSLLALNLLAITTAAPNLLQSLGELKFPALLVRVLESMLRYLAVLIDELGSMRRAAQARSNGLGALLGWRTLGNVLGALFLRTYGRGERTHLAMQARGFTGQFIDPTTRPFGISEWVALALTFALLITGQYVLWQGG